MEGKQLHCEPSLGDAIGRATILCGTAVEAIVDGQGMSSFRWPVPIAEESWYTVEQTSSTSGEAFEEVSATKLSARVLVQLVAYQAHVVGCFQWPREATRSTRA